MRTTPNIANLLIRPDYIITIPYITGGINCSTVERLLSLPAKMGGLGKPIFSEFADFDYATQEKSLKHLH